MIPDKTKVLMFVLQIATTITVAVMVYVAIPWVKAVNSHEAMMEKRLAEIDKWITMRPTPMTVDAVELAVLRAKEVIRDETNKKLDELLKTVNEMRLDLAKHVSAMNPTP